MGCAPSDLTGDALDHGLYFRLTALCAVRFELRCDLTFRLISPGSPLEISLPPQPHWQPLLRPPSLGQAYQLTAGMLDGLTKLHACVPQKFAINQRSCSKPQEFICHDYSHWRV